MLDYPCTLSASRPISAAVRNGRLASCVRVTLYINTDICLYSHSRWPKCCFIYVYTHTRARALFGNFTTRQLSYLYNVRMTKYLCSLNRNSYLYLYIKFMNCISKLLFCDGSMCDIITSITTHSISQVDSTLNMFSF